MRTRSVLALALTVWLLAAGAGAQPAPATSKALEIKVLAKETHGLLYLLESLRGEAHHSRHLAEVFWAAHAQSAEDTRALDSFHRLLERSSWLQLSLPGDGPKRRRLSDILEVAALQAGDAEDFLERMQMVLNIEDHRSLALAVRHFAPLYHRVIWEPGQREFLQQTQELTEELKKSAMGQRMAQARHFYASQWPQERAFWVALVPIPHKAGEKFNTYGHSDSFLEVVEVPGGAPVRASVGVVFHELCHSLWSTCPAEAHQQLRANFDEYGDAGRYAYDQLNESLATALGNGWFQSLADGKLRSDSWYQDLVIDEYAKALFEPVKLALDNGTGMDRTFVAQAVQRFRQHFPNFADDVNIVLREIVIISNLPAVHRGDFQNRLSALRFMRSVYATSDLGGESTQEMLQKHRYASRFYFIRPDQRRRLQELYDFPNLPERGLVTIRKNETWHIVVVATNSEDYVNLLADLTKDRYLKSAAVGPYPW